MLNAACRPPTKGQGARQRDKVSPSCIPNSTCGSPQFTHPPAARARRKWAAEPQRAPDHVAATAVAARDRDAELAALRERVGRLERFKRHLAVAYAAVALVAGTAWGVLVDWVKGEFFAAKP